MATSITTTYAGEDLAGYISKALLEGTTISGGHVSIVNDIKYKKAIKKLDATGMIQAYACDFADAGTLTLTEAILEPKKFKINKQECKDTFKPYWKNLDQELQNVIADYYTKIASTEVERLIWAGSTGGGDIIDGFVTKALADGTVIDVSTPVTLTKANIIAEMERSFDVVPNAVKTDTELRIFLNPTAYYFFLQAQNGLGITSNNGAIGVDSFYGIPVVKANGLATGRMMIASKNNLFVGTHLLNEENQVNVIDLTPIDGSDNVRFILHSSIDVDYANGSEIVLY